MKIVILSDIHDNVWKLAALLQNITNADAMICCGDLCSPFIVPQLAAGFAGPIHIVFGNNDGDLFRITQNAARFDHVHLHGEFLEIELGGKRFAVNHYDHIARRLAASDTYDVVCYGHNHIYQVERVGKTLTINPGPVMGYSPAQQQDVPSTYVIYDTATDEATRFTVSY